MLSFMRFAGELFTPLNLIIALLVCGLVLHLSRKTVVGNFMIGVGICLLLLCGYAPGAMTYIEEKEQRHPALAEAVLGEFLSIRYVVVLGSGHITDARLPATSQIGGSSLYRLVEGIRLHRQLPDSMLFIAGGAVSDPVPNARVVARVANQLGVDSEKVLVLDTPRDTVEEAEAVFRVIGAQPFILVTSALHMPRAMNVFQGKGLKPIAAPTDFIIKNHGRKGATSWLPSAANVDLSKRILYELAGGVWSKISAR